MEGLDYSKYDFEAFNIWENKFYFKLYDLVQKKVNEIHDLSLMDSIEFEVWGYDENYNSLFRELPLETYDRHCLLDCSNLFRLNTKTSDQFHKWLHALSLQHFLFSLNEYLDVFYAELNQYMGRKFQSRFIQNQLVLLRNEIKSLTRPNYLLEDIETNEIFSFSHLQNRFDTYFYNKDLELKPLIDLFLCHTLEDLSYIKFPPIFEEYITTIKYLTKTLALKQAFEDVNNDQVVIIDVKQQITEDILARQDPAFVLAIARILKKPDYAIIISDVLDSVSDKNLSFFSNLFMYFKQEKNLGCIFKDSQPKEYIKIVNECYPQKGFKRVVTHNITDTYVNYFDSSVSKYLKNR